jgi:hypothetical protein
MRGQVTFIVVALLAVLAPAALAARPATSEEQAAIAAALSLPPQCITARVSTVDETWSRADLTNTAGCPMGDGLTVLRQQSGQWTSVHQGPADLEPCPVEPIPTRVAVDLRVCRRPRTYILCWPGGRDTERELRRHPARCNSLGPRDSFGTSVNLARLRWRGWGNSVARARGIERGFHHPLQRITVRVRAYRRKRCPDGDYLYTRLRATSRHGSLVVRYPRDCSD